MKSRLVTGGLVVGGVALILYVFLWNQTIFALVGRDLEMNFVVHDAETDEPIPNAAIDLIAEERKENGKETRVIKLVTDDDGRARFVHENNSCEDVIRPFRRTVTLIDLTWAVVNVSAKGYRPIEKMWLHFSKYKNLGYISKDRVQRVEFDIALHRQLDH
jgi:hypothetical protein